MPTNIPQEHIYDSESLFPYPEDGVKGVYLQAFRAKGQDLERSYCQVNNILCNLVLRDGYGKITMPLDTIIQLVRHTVNEVPDTTALLKRLESLKNLSNYLLYVLGDHYVPKGKS